MNQDELNISPEIQQDLQVAIAANLQASAIVIDDAELDRAAKESIELLPETYRNIVLAEYLENAAFGAQLKASIAYVAIRTSMARTVTANLQDFAEIAFSVPDNGAEDFYIKMIAEILLNEVRDDPEPDDDTLLVSKDVFLERVEHIRAYYSAK